MGSEVRTHETKYKTQQGAHSNTKIPSKQKTSNDRDWEWEWKYEDEEEEEEETVKSQIKNNHNNVKTHDINTHKKTITPTKEINSPIIQYNPNAYLPSATPIPQLPTVRVRKTRDKQHVLRKDPLHDKAIEAYTTNAIHYEPKELCKINRLPKYFYNDIEELHITDSKKRIWGLEANKNYYVDKEENNEVKLSTKPRIRGPRREFKFPLNDHNSKVNKEWTYNFTNESNTVNNYIGYSKQESTQGLLIKLGYPMLNTLDTSVINTKIDSEENYKGFNLDNPLADCLKTKERSINEQKKKDYMSKLRNGKVGISKYGHFIMNSSFKNNS